MVISAEQLERFKVLYKKRFGKELADQEAYDKALKLISLMKLIYRPLPENIAQNGTSEV